MSAGRCRQCDKPVRGTGEYVPLTCGHSECQQQEACDNFHRNAAMRGGRRHLRNKSCPALEGCRRENAS